MLPPLNDTRCLQILHEYAAQVEAEALRAQYIDIDELVALIRALDDRQDRAQRDVRPSTTEIQSSHTGESHAADSAAQ